MSKDIASPDEVYDRLARENGDRSISEVIAAKLDERRLMDVTGTQVLDPETMDVVDRELGRLSGRTVDRLDSSDEAV